MSHPIGTKLVVIACGEGYPASVLGNTALSLGEYKPKPNENLNWPGKTIEDMTWCRPLEGFWPDPNQEGIYPTDGS